MRFRQFPLMAQCAAGLVITAGLRKCAAESDADVTTLHSTRSHRKTGASSACWPNSASQV